MMIPLAACFLNQPLERTIKFSGYEWLVKDSGVDKVAPGNNYFSNSSDSVYVDQYGRLHLKVRHDKDGWKCAEVYMKKSLGYGCYSFELHSSPANLDPQMVLGLFTYEINTLPEQVKEGNYQREIDIELSQWSDPNNQNAQFTIQPAEYKTGVKDSNNNDLYAEIPENKFRFNAPPSTPKPGYFTRQYGRYSFLWSEQKINYEYEAPDQNLTVKQLQPPRPSTTFPGIKYYPELPWKKMASWSYAGQYNPHPENEVVHINLYLFRGSDPKNGKACEIIIGRFKFKK